jgi:hypothetical protein
MLIAEELYLLLTDDDTGKQERPGTMRSYGLTAAVLADLVVSGRVALSDERKPRVTIVDASPTGNPVLDGALETLARRDGKRVDSLVTWSKLDPELAVVDSLVAAGILERGAPTMLGLGRPRTPAVDTSPERLMRSRLRDVLAGTRRPTAADATLLSILQGLNIAAPLLKEESGGLRAHEMKKRIAAVVDESAVGDAVARAVAAMNSAMITAAIVPAITSSSSG